MLKYEYKICICTIIDTELLNTIWNAEKFLLWPNNRASSDADGEG